MHSNLQVRLSRRNQEQRKLLKTRENQRVQTGQVGLANRRLQPLGNLSEPACAAFHATTLATTFGRFGPSRNPLKHWRFVQIENRC